MAHSRWEDVKRRRVEADEVRTLADLPGYKIYGDGTIVSPKGRLIVQRLRTNGYLCFHGPKIDGKPQVLDVHLVVCRAFHGERPPGMYACHGVGTLRTDNRATNLRWDSPSANQQDRIADGTDNGGERNHFAKLTWETVREIRATVATQKQLAERHEVSRATICRILQGKIWRERQDDD